MKYVKHEWDEDYESSSSASHDELRSVSNSINLKCTQL